jgi:probable O-glycosylation ligase (exosortase A-associated)
VYFSFIGGGIAAPFIFTLGYVWVDTFRPQDVAYFLLNQFPVAMVIGATAIGAYFMMDRKCPPRFSLIAGLQLSLAAWVTLTAWWAEVPDAAWMKWDWAFKRILFSAFVPLVIRSRVQIEAYIQTYLFALAANIIPFGLKTLINGGGYGRNLGLLEGNSGLSEGGYLSTVCLMAIPFAFALGRHTLLLPNGRLIRVAYFALAGLAMVTAIGTFERSALIGLVVLGSYMFTRSRRKLAFGVMALVLAAGLSYVASDQWTARMSTAKDYNRENSALTRLLVWEWTLGYAARHPFGGGFEASRISRIELPSADEGSEPVVQFGRAFHSIYFEMLGEQGWIGLGMFLVLGLLSFGSLRRTARRARADPDLAWCGAMADAAQSALATFMTAGAFVGMACQPPFWFIMACTISLREYVRRATTGDPSTSQQGSMRWPPSLMQLQARVLPAARLRR